MSAKRENPIMKSNRRAQLTDTWSEFTSMPRGKGIRGNTYGGSVRYEPYGQPTMPSPSWYSEYVLTDDDHHGGHPPPPPPKRQGHVSHGEVLVSIEYDVWCILYD
jgi:hypothetical protein